jgi:hypothetical protein
MTSYTLIPGLATVVAKSGAGVRVLPKYMFGQGTIVNPASAADQGIRAAEPLFVSQVDQDLRPVGLVANQTTVALLPGQRMTFPPDAIYGVWATAKTPGHRFTAYYVALGDNYPPTPIPSTFPPATYTTMTKLIPSYPYKEYDDDDDIVSWVMSYNQLGQRFIDTLVTLNLPIYTKDNIAGLLLDWVGAGIYGKPRPNLSTQMAEIIGPFNTYQFNTMTYNGSTQVGPANIVVTDDDAYKRILTWALLKGDGKICNVRWLKRRIMRFLIGKNGVNPNIDQTYQISITFGPNYEMAIKFIDEITTPTFGAEFDGFMFNTAQYNEQEIEVTPLSPLPYRQTFQEAVLSGAIEMPFQFTINVIL